MRIKYSAEEMSAYTKMLEDDFDLIRFVKPFEQHVFYSNGQSENTELCTHIWGSSERCENCSSNRAFQARSSAYKLEFQKDDVFLVTSKYIELDGEPMVLEAITKVTEKFFFNDMEKNEIQKIMGHYSHLLITDPLTGAYNRRFLDENLIPAFTYYKNEGISVHTAFMDMDGFKEINDIYGHQAGDGLLKHVVGFWKQSFDSRKRGFEKLVIRFGGDEFLLISCGSPFAEFRETVTALYESMDRIFPYSADTQLPFSISIGFSSSEETDGDWSWHQLLSVADQQMYEEKRQKKIKNGA